jgi:hypothetical protein
VFDNFWSDGARTALLSLARPDGSVVTATLTITDDEAAPSVRPVPRPAPVILARLN